MGSCVSNTQSNKSNTSNVENPLLTKNAKEDKKKSKLISRELDQDRREAYKTKKLLLLGYQGSGKSTMYKQIIHLQQPLGFQPHEREAYMAAIHKQCINEMKIALELYEDYIYDQQLFICGYLRDIENIVQSIIPSIIHSIVLWVLAQYNDDEFIPTLSQDALESKHTLLSTSSTAPLDTQIVACIQTLWKEPAIVKIYSKGNKLLRSNPYFWNRLDEITNSYSYLPTDQDIINLGYNEPYLCDRYFYVRRSKFTLVQLGQNTSRKQWIQYFDDVVAIVFMVDLSSYDSFVVDTDDDHQEVYMNSMTRQLQLFDSVCNDIYLNNIPVILYFNKRDLFQDKIKKISLDACSSFIDYNGQNNSFKQTSEYIKEKFLALNRNKGRRSIYTHLICAFDARIDTLFNDVQHIVIENSLFCAGLMKDEDNDVGFVHGGFVESNNTMIQLRRSVLQCNTLPAIDTFGYDYNGLFDGYQFDTKHCRTMGADIDKTQNVDDIYNDIEEMKYDVDDYTKHFDVCYSCAVVKPLTLEEEEKKNESEYEFYMNVELVFRLFDQTHFERKHLNLVLVLDTSNSMGCLMDNGQKRITAATECIVSLLNNLTSKDRLGVIAFANKVKIMQKLTFINNIDITHLKNQILKIEECSSTNLQNAYIEGIYLYKELDYKDDVSNEYDQRIIFITDTHPNYNVNDQSRLLTTVEKYAQSDILNGCIYTTFVAIGLDFNEKWINQLKSVRGCNYFCIKQRNQLTKILNTQFKFTVSPIAFNLSLTLKYDSSLYFSPEVYGRDVASGSEHEAFQVERIKTFFISNESNKNSGFRLMYLPNFKAPVVQKQSHLELELRFEDPNGKLYCYNEFVPFQSILAECNGNNFYDNMGMRKGILLVKYIEVLASARHAMNEYIKYDRKDKQLVKKNKKMLTCFLKHLEQEMNVINDNYNTLQREVDVIKKLCKFEFL